MPWFSCNNCNDTIKKPKVAQHLQRCYGASFTCIDCSRTFDCHSVQSHNSCVTEVQKYNEGATKPGGAASGGFFQDSGAPKSVPEALGGEFLSTSVPWKCLVCNVVCTSQETLLSHAGGAKHKRRSKAAIAARSTGTGTPAAKTGPPAVKADTPAGKTGTPAAKDAPRPSPHAASAPAATPASAATPETTKPSAEAKSTESKDKGAKGKKRKGTAAPAAVEVEESSQPDSKKQKQPASSKDSDSQTEDREPTAASADLVDKISKKLKKKGTLPLARLADMVLKKSGSNHAELTSLLQLLSGPGGSAFKVEVTLA